MIVKITSKRQVTFPAKVLDTLGVGPGDHLELQDSPDGFILRPRRITPTFIPPLRDKINPDAEPIDMETFRSQPYDPSLRD